MRPFIIVALTTAGLAVSVPIQGTMSSDVPEGTSTVAAAGEDVGDSGAMYVARNNQLALRSNAQTTPRRGDSAQFAELFDRHRREEHTEVIELPTPPPSHANVDAAPQSHENVDAAPPSHENIVVAPPSHENVDAAPPSHEHVDAAPPSHEHVDAAPPSYENAAPPSNVDRPPSYSALLAIERRKKAKLMCLGAIGIVCVLAIVLFKITEPHGTHPSRRNESPESFAGFHKAFSYTRRREDQPQEYDNNNLIELMTPLFDPEAHSTNDLH
ncbi:hypothetical protein BC835DRAFT_1424202 [Cytidiella melzeri]|nr:hypothetical protein BC835DRAFT_1424202 [Cytidiella melzeri]